MTRHSTTPTNLRRQRQSGQVLPIVAVLMIGLLALAALSIDVGRVYYSFRELQASTDAAAMAGAQALPQTTAVAQATLYSAVGTTNKNSQANLPGVTMVTGYPQVKCVTALTNLYGVLCESPANANAIQVKQQVTVSSLFLLGARSTTLTASASAAMKGAPGPYNVALVVDTTGSMSSADNDGQCGGVSRLACALAGVRVFLTDLTPCSAARSTCTPFTANASGGGSNSGAPVERVSLWTFPSMLASTASRDYGTTCPSSPTIEKYTAPFPTTGAGAYTYEVVNWSTDYRLSDTATTLNTSTTTPSNLVQSVGTTATNICLKNPGGAGTYYAQVIYQAQAALVAEQSLNPNTKNVMIILSDGDATAGSSDFAGTGILTSGATSYNSSFYPATYYECNQAITAANAATAAGTLVYTVAYGAQATGCLSDNQQCSGTVANDCVPTGDRLYPLITPCSTLQQMASTPYTFYSDNTSTQGAGNVCSSVHTTSNLNTIFAGIASDLSVPRLIPDNWT